MKDTWSASPPPQQAYVDQPISYISNQPHLAVNTDRRYIYGEYSSHPGPVPVSRDLENGHCHGQPFEFDSISLHKDFLRKVLINLGIQILLSTVIISLFVFIKPVSDWVEEAGLKGAVLPFLLASIFFTIPLYTWDAIRRRFPFNIVLQIMITITYSCTAGAVSAFMGTSAVLIAAGFTLSICLVLLLFSLQSKLDFSIKAGFLLMAILFLVLSAIICILIFAIKVIDSETTGPGILVGGIGALVLSLVIVVSLDCVMDGKFCCFEISEEEYVLASTLLYTEILMIFVIVVLLVAGGSSGCKGGGGGAGCRGGLVCCYCGGGGCHTRSREDDDDEECCSGCCPCCCKRGES